MEFKKYTDIIRHGKNGTHLTIEGNVDIVVQEKIDGSNASFKVVNGQILAFSRNTELDESNNLRGFYQWTQTLDPSKLLEGVIYFGEWTARHKIDYKENLNKFFLFDIYNEHTLEYVSFSMVEDESKRLGLNLVPVFYIGKALSFEEIAKFAGQSKLTDVGEGVVVKNYNYKNKYEAQVFTKIVTTEFQEMNGVKSPKVTTAKKDSFDQFLDTYMTKARVEKIIHKMVDEQVLSEDYAIEDMGTILKNAGTRVYDDLIKEELDSLLKQLKAKVGKRLPVVIKEILVEQNRA